MEAQLLGLAQDPEKISLAAVLAAACFASLASNGEYDLHTSETMQLVVRAKDEAWILGTLDQPLSSGFGPQELLVAIMLMPILSLGASLDFGESLDMGASAGTATVH